MFRTGGVADEASQASHPAQQATRSSWETPRFRRRVERGKEASA
jgi:hypothetical protein